MVELTGSSGTGKKILDNWNVFTFKLKSNEAQGESNIVTFQFSSSNQTGTFIILLDKKGQIKNLSTLNCNKFKRSLGMNNDSSLQQLAEKLLTTEGISYI